MKKTTVISKTIENMEGNYYRYVHTEYDIDVSRGLKIYQAMLLDMDKDTAEEMSSSDGSVKWTQYECGLTGEVSVFKTGDDSHYHALARWNDFKHSHGKYVSISVNTESGYATLSVSHHYHHA